MSELSIISWLWRQPGGRCEYSAHHVNIWAAMVKRHLKRPHRLACVTDTPDGIEPWVEIISPPREFEAVRIPTWKEHRPQCLRRISMFRPDAAGIFGERFVCMDLDCVITGPLDPFFADDPDFRIATGSLPGMPYNGSMMFITAGSRPEVYERFTPDGAVEAGRKFTGSDQAWISHVLGPNEKRWTEADGLARWRHGCDAPLMFFPGAVKPWDVLAGDEIVAKHYRRDGRLKGLVLGRGHSVWQEAEAALEQTRFDGVIALREAARHWPGKVDAIANSDDHALKLAVMLGYADVTFCGKGKEAA